VSYPSYDESSSILRTNTATTSRFLNSGFYALFRDHANASHVLGAELDRMAGAEALSQIGKVASG